MNKIWFFGCSLTYGSGLRAIDASLDNRWTKLVADHFGMTEENRGSPGASNEMILIPSYFMFTSFSRCESHERRVVV